MTVVLGFLCAMAFLNQMTAFRMESAKPLKKQAKVSVLIPLRNESARLERLLSNLSAILAPNVEILLLNDESTDDTWEVLQRTSKQGFRILQGKPIPTGWVGKPWACSQLAEAAQGEILLFCDADVSMSGQAVERTISLMEEHQADALTALPHQELPTVFEKAIVPFVMHLPVLGLLPLRWICQLRSASLLVANGQWFAFKREAYFKTGGHASVANSLLEDMYLGRKLVKQGLKLLPVLATKDLKVRMYDSWHSLTEGFTKNLFLLAGGTALSGLALFSVSLWIYLGPIVLAITERPSAGLSLFLLLVFRSLCAFSFRVPLGSIWLHPLGAVGFLWLLGRSCLAHFRNQVSWRGRFVQIPN